MIDPATFPDAEAWVGTTCIPMDLDTFDDARFWFANEARHPDRFVGHPAQVAELLADIYARRPHDHHGVKIIADFNVPTINGGHDYCGAMIGKDGAIVAVCSGVPRAPEGTARNRAAAQARCDARRGSDGR